MTPDNALVEFRGGEARALTKSEQHLLKEKESIIEKGAEAFVQVGEALMTIRDKRLYRADFSSFEEYCRRRWSMSKSNANRCIAANSVMNNLQDVDKNVLPRAESQVRPLTLLKPAEQKRVWKRVVEEVKQSQRPLTANIVTRKISETFPEIVTYRKPTQPKRGHRVRLEKEEVLDHLAETWRRDKDELKNAEPDDVIKWVRKIISGM